MIENLKQQSLPSDCFVFKHSTRCPISSGAAEEVRGHDWHRPGARGERGREPVGVGLFRRIGLRNVGEREDIALQPTDAILTTKDNYEKFLKNHP